MKDKKYNVIISEKNDKFYASIDELNLIVEANSYFEALEKCIEKQSEIIKIFNEKNVSLPKKISHENFNSESYNKFRRLISFFFKEIASSIIIILTFLIIIIATFPFFKNYITTTSGQEILNKLENKFGLSITLKD